jgi:hypothetical protein
VLVWAIRMEMQAYHHRVLVHWCARLLKLLAATQCCMLPANFNLLKPADKTSALSSA